MAKTSASPCIRPGDLAIFTSGLNLGKLVHIDRAFTGEEVIDGTHFCKTPSAHRAWVVTSLCGPLVCRLVDKTINPKRFLQAAFDEDVLRPLRNPRGTDESLCWGVTRPTSRILKRANV